MLRTSMRSLAAAKAAQDRAHEPEGELTTVDSVLSPKGTRRFTRNNVPSEWDSGYRPGVHVIDNLLLPKSYVQHAASL